MGISVARLRWRARHIIKSRQLKFVVKKKCTYHAKHWFCISKLNSMWANDAIWWHSSLHEPMLTHQCYYVAFICEQFHMKCPWHVIGDDTFEITTISLRDNELIKKTIKIRRYDIGTMFNGNLWKSICFYFGFEDVAYCPPSCVKKHFGHVAKHH